MRQEYKDEVIEIFHKLVAAKRAGLFSARALAESEMNMLAEHVAKQQEAQG